MSTRDDELTGKVALVTGAGRRIGAAIVRRLHGAGMHVALHYRRSRAEAERLCAELNAAGGAEAAPFAADLLESAAAGALVGEAVRRFGRLDVLVNNASSFYATPLGDIDETAFRDLVGTNLAAPLFLAQAAAPHLRAARGCIVNLADIYGLRPPRGYAVYGAAKGGLITLTRALAEDLAPQVRVNAIAPGAILWPEDGDESAAQRILARVPLGRTGTVEEIAATVLYLVRDAGYTTGALVRVDGGREIG
ncbi:MAG: pteridine reductase [Gammaproteobacteria bacterium]|nr:pteridine reductase [Gammaproteobacteria bacterium]